MSQAINEETKAEAPVLETDKTSGIYVSGWRILASVGALPALFNEYVANASFVDQISMNDKLETGVSFYAISKPGSQNKSNWPDVVIAQRYCSAGYDMFHPGILIVPETSILFIGAGTRLLAYDLSKSRKLWEDYVELGFFRWEQTGETILMSAEITLAAWNTKGEKLWEKFVEPPWHYTLNGNQVRLDIMGAVSHFDISTGLSF